MSKIKLLAAAAVVASLGASLTADPASAQGWRRGGFGPGAVAAGIAGAAIGGAIASSQFRDSYAYYGNDYAPTYGYSYEPGYSYGYGPGYRRGDTWNSNAGSGGYNTGATNYYYNSW